MEYAIYYVLRDVAALLTIILFSGTVAVLLGLGA